jgi:hypothetical protein
MLAFLISPTGQSYKEWIGCQAKITYQRRVLVFDGVTVMRKALKPW